MEESVDLRAKPPCDRDDAIAVLKRLREAGHIAYFAGGCVRDTLLGLKPKDWDIATNAPPQRVREIFSNTQAVGAAFGVILVRHRKSVIEVATFRSDGVYLDGRHPASVQYTTPEEDAKRRDFTINALFFDPIENKVIDFVGGQDDLNHRRLRGVGNPLERFQEDHLRLLRAVRFAARFNFSVDPPTAAAIRTAAVQLKGISPERIGGELRLMLTPTSRSIAWPRLWDFDLAPEIFRFLPVPANFKFDPRRSLLLALMKSQAIPFGLALAAATLEIRLQSDSDGNVIPLLQKPQAQKSVQAMRKALHISNDESDEMAETLIGLHPLLASEEPTLAAKRRFLARPTAPLSRALMEAMHQLQIQTERIQNLTPQLAALDGQDNNPAPLINGDDLEAAGLKPGPAFKRILDAVYDAQLEGKISTPDEAIRLALALQSPNSRSEKI